MKHRQLGYWSARASLTVGAVLLASASFAQQNASEAAAQVGFQPDRNYFSPESFESFDPVNGNIVLSDVYNKIDAVIMDPSGAYRSKANDPVFAPGFFPQD